MKPKVINGPVLYGKHWKDQPCYCKEAFKTLGGAHVVCASCACNRRKKEEHFIAYKLNSGYMFFVDIIGPPLIPKIVNRKIHRNWLSREERRFDRTPMETPLSLTSERARRDNE